MFAVKFQGLARIMDMVLPPRCVVTGEIVQSQGQITGKAWSKLNFIERPFCQKCGIPFSYQTDDTLICTDCLDRPPNFDKARSALVYDEESRRLILQFKHGDHTEHALAFVPWLMRAAQNMIVESDVIVPVPLHRWRLWRRRYNQAALMAYELAYATNMDYKPDILTRTRATQSQGHLKFKDRRKNVKKAFALNPDYAALVKGKNVLLMDDVYTTGSTITECTAVLKKAGAAKVNVLTLARVLKPEAMY